MYVAVASPYPWDRGVIVLLVLFGTTATFIRLVSLLIADIASSFEALVLSFLVLVFVPRGSLLSL